MIYSSVINDSSHLFFFLIVFLLNVSGALSPQSGPVTKVLYNVEWKKRCFCRKLCFGFTSKPECLDKAKKIQQGNKRQWADLKWPRRGDAGIKSLTEGSCISIKTQALHHCLLHGPIIFRVLYISYTAMFVLPAGNIYICI